MKKIIDFIVTYIWQAPQMLLAYIWFLIMKEHIVKVIEKDSYKVYMLDVENYVALGNRVFVGNRMPGYVEYLIAHEYGHTKQSKMLGPLYLIIIGIPSALWKSIHGYFFPNISYYWFYTEAWANKLAGLIVNENGHLMYEHY